jgi:hypothetical protein
VSTAQPAAAPRWGLLDFVERRAWGIPLPTRRLFLVLAWFTAGVLLAAGLTGAWIEARNEATINGAQDHGFLIARNAASYRTNLAAADAIAARTLIAGGLESSDSRRAYTEALLGASSALTDAALVATDADRDAIETLADGLVRYSGLVETARANARLGYPVGNAYLQQARILANDQLIPTAEQLRREGEQRVARAANDIGGVFGIVAVALLALATCVIVVASVIVAGRTRRMLHPALIVSTVAIALATFVVIGSISRQVNALRSAATTDFADFVDVNDTAYLLSTLRTTEIAAVGARGSGAAIFEQFQSGADDLRDRLDEDERATTETRQAVAGYLDMVRTVQDTDAGGDNQQAIAMTLDGPSAQAFDAANSAVTDELDGTADDLSRRIDRARNATIAAPVPLALGVLAALLAAAGILSRGRRYR